MKLMEKHPLVMIIIGIAGISLSAIFVKYSQAPAVVTALYRLLWTVALMTPVTKKRCFTMRQGTLLPARPWLPWNGPESFSAS